MGNASSFVLSTAGYGRGLCFIRVIGHFVCFLMSMELVFIELHWRDNKGLLSRGANLPV